MVIQRLYSEETKKVVDEAEKSTKKGSKKVAESLKNKKSVMEGLKKKGAELLKNPKVKKWGCIGIGATGGTLAVSGIDSAVKKAKEKKKENDIKKQILGNLNKK